MATINPAIIPENITISVSPDNLVCVSDSTVYAVDSTIIEEFNSSRETIARREYTVVDQNPQP